MSEMDKLEQMLKEAGIPHEVTYQEEFPGNPKQIWYPCRERVVYNAVCNAMSYGHEEGLLEIMGFVNVEGHLLAEEVFERIQKHYLSVKQYMEADRDKGRDKMFIRLKDDISEAIINLDDVQIIKKASKYGFVILFQLKNVSDPYSLNYKDEKERDSVFDSIFDALEKRGI